MKNRVLMAKVGRPHGIRGEITLICDESQLDLLKKGMTLFLSKEGQDSITLEKISKGPKTIVKVAGFSNRDEADSLKGKELYLPRSQFPKLEAGEYYLVDLLGLDVFEKEQKVGVVFQTYSHGAQENIVVKSQNGELFDVPLLEYFVLSIDFDNGRIQIERPEFI